MGAWIEIQLTALHLMLQSSHPTMGAWIEIIYSLALTPDVLSHPTMGAWIEIQIIGVCVQCVVVAPHDGCVD